nr:MAG TPA: hypothetical protein [Caudoviricetes sp.]
MKTVFKEGMEVWDKTISPNKGKVIEAFADTKFDFPIKVEFEDGLKVQYTNDGCFVKSKGAINTLSTSNYSIDFKGFEQKAPVPTFEDAIKWLRENNKYDVSISDDSKATYFTKDENYSAFEALRKLTILREYYNEGWQPDWEDDEWKYFIEYYRGKLSVERTCGNNRVLAFKSSEIRDKFLEDQRELLEIAKPLL